MLEAIITGLSYLISAKVIVLMFAGVILGLIVGILPGIGGTTTLAILLPLTFSMDPALALAFLVSVHAVTGTSGGVTSILLGIPGEGSAVATIIDGYPMSRKGHAGRALGNMFMASMLGGVFGGLVLAALIPVARPVVLAFGSPEMMMMALLGISFIAVLGRGSMLKALASAGLGLFFASVGFHTFSGSMRYSLNSDYLFGGLEMIPVFLGVFALVEAVDLAVGGGTIAKVEQARIMGSDVMQGCKDVFKHWWLMLRCSAIGAAIGIIPGIGGGVAQWMCYGHAKQTSKRADEFGTGCEEGVIATESGNNSKEGGALLTTMAFGIPGSIGMAVLIGALIMVGIDPGPEMLSKHLDIVWTVVGTLIFANILATALCLALAKQLIRVTFLSSNTLVPIVLLLIVIGSYCMRQEPLDIWATVVFGAVGYLLKTFDYSRVTFCVAFILGTYIEKYFLISLSSLGPTFLLQPIALSLLIITIFSLSYGGLKSVFKRIRAGQSKGVTE